MEAVAEEYRPNFLCNYLYELAGYFTSFYENCPVLTAKANLKEARLALIKATQITLANTLGLLGISAPEKM